MSEERKLVEIFEESEETSRRMNTPVVEVAFSSAFTAVTTFFTSIIIAKYNDYDISVSIPTLFLIISTFGFLYATLVFANTNGMLVAGHVRKARMSDLLGDILSEYLGVYFLVLAIPLIINVISRDPFLRIATLIIDLGGLLVYHVSGFSIMERHYRRYHLIFLGIIYLLEYWLVLFQFSDKILFEGTAMLLILFILILAFFARTGSPYKEENS